MSEPAEDIDETYEGWATRWGWIPGLVVIVLAILMAVYDPTCHCSCQVKSTPTPSEVGKPS